MTDKMKEILIKYFVKFYGENYRTLITQKINTIIPISYDSLETKTSLKYEKQSTKEIELTLKFLKHHDIELPEEIKEKIIKNNNTIYITRIKEIEELLKKYFESYEYRRTGGIRDILESPSDNKILVNNSVYALKNFGIELSPEEFNIWVTSQEGQEVIEKIKEEKAFIRTLDEEYDKFNEQFKELNDALNKSYELRNALMNKYELKFLKYIEKYLTPRDLKLLEEYNKKETKQPQDKDELFNNLDIFKIVTQGLYSVGIIESFTPSSEEILKSPENSYQKETIIENRIKYFTLIGIYDGSPKEEFINSSIAKQNKPQQEFIECIMEAKEKCIEELDTELLIATSTYKENQETIESLNLADKNITVLDKIKEKAICINLVSSKQNLNLINLLFFSEGAALSEYKDVLFVHEINHIIESSIIGRDKEGVTHYKTGFEEIINDYDNERPYEVFSENINHLIAMEITTLMHNDSVYLFDNPNISKITGATFFERLNCLTYKFYTTFKEILKIARTSNSLEPLFEIVGRENFEKFNKIINEYISLPLDTISISLSNGETNDLTKKREELLAQAEEVYNNMLHYKERTWRI